MKTICPGCNAQNPTSEHLLKEYKSLLRAGFHDIFGRNARAACNEVVQMLLNRGITQYDDIFGPVKISKWTY